MTWSRRRSTKRSETMTPKQSEPTLINSVKNSELYAMLKPLQAQPANSPRSREFAKTLLVTSQLLTVRKEIVWQVISTRTQRKELSSSEANLPVHSEEN